ncbi:MAG: aspartate/glutamate racemase family protein, partial [Chromatiales bacterium]|nr:aspartate/glutamate racemase family protein [Chromatiales bacterium]
MNIVSGGKTVAGASLGMLVLQSNFPRISGDGANAQTWPFPVLYKVVGGATPARVVLQNAEGLVDAFAGAANELVAAGADGITTSCGFLILHQQTLASACQVPVATSSLMQVSAVQALLPPGRRVGVVTISRQALTPQHLANAGAPLDTPIEGTE